MPVSKHVRRVLALVGTAGLAGAILLTAPTAIAGTQQNYLVVYKGATVPAKVAASIREAGGTVIANYSEIGVAVVRSANPFLTANVKRDTYVAGVAATAGLATRLSDDATANGGPAAPPDIPATDSDSLSGLQWDMVQIHTPEAHAITGGSPTVIVGDIDTGLDYTHPDLAANVDDAASVNCVSGAPVAGQGRREWTTTVTAHIRPGRSRRRPTASASSAWRPT